MGATWIAATISALCGSALAEDGEPTDLLADHTRWRRFHQKEMVTSRWDGQGRLVVAKPEGVGRVTYRHKLPLPGARLCAQVRFLGQLSESTRGGLVFYGATAAGKAVELSISPEGEVMEIGGQTRQFRRLVEDPYRYEVECRFGLGCVEMYSGGRQMGKADEQYETDVVSIVVSVANGSMAVDRLSFEPNAEAHQTVIEARSYVDVALRADREALAALPSQWTAYFGTHYARTPEDAGIRFNTVRSYGGTHVGVTRDESKRHASSPVHVGPFTGQKVKVGLDGFHSQSRFAKNPPTARTLIPDLIANGITAIYLTNHFMRRPAEGGVETFDRDLAYWTILHRGLRFMTWVAMDRLNAQQARLVWWGEGERAGGSGAEMMRTLGRFFGTRSLCFWREERGDATFYVLTAGTGGSADRVLVVIMPQRSIDVGTLRLEQPSLLDGKWSVRAVQYSSLALPEPVRARLTREGSGTAIGLRRRITEPLVVYLEAGQ